MKLYRTTKVNYAADLCGIGGLYEAGRWHREGTQIVYTSAFVALAMLEVLGHWAKAPTGLALVTIEVPDEASTLLIDATTLPAGWLELPYLSALADLTDRWIEAGEQWIMRVPSVHSPTEYNYLLNPLHPEHATLKLVSVESHPFDPRLK